MEQGEHRIAASSMGEDWGKRRASLRHEVSLDALAVDPKCGNIECRINDRPTIHVNLGRARALINAATDTVFAATAETDARIEAGVTPTEGDYFRQTSAGTQAVMLCDEAMTLLCCAGAV